MLKAREDRSHFQRRERPRTLSRDTERITDSVRRAVADTSVILDGDLSDLNTSLLALSEGESDDSSIKSELRHLTSAEEAMREELAEVESNYQRYRREVEDEKVDGNGEQQQQQRERIQDERSMRSNPKNDDRSSTECTTTDSEPSHEEEHSFVKMASLVDDFEHQRAAASPPISSIRVAWEEKLLYSNNSGQSRPSRELIFSPQPFLDRILKYRHVEGQDDRWISLAFLSNLLTLQLHSQKTTPTAPQFSTKSFCPGILGPLLNAKIGQSPSTGDSLNLWRLTVPVLGSIRPLKPTIQPRSRKQPRQLQMLLFSDLIGRALRPTSSRIEEIE